MPVNVAIEVAGLSRRFGDVQAVDGIDLVVPVGSVYGFLGPNGAGKTTTIRMLLGLLRPDHGAIRLFGNALRDHKLALLRRVGSLVESPSLYSHLTGQENLEIRRLLLGGTRDDVARALRLVDLSADAHRLVRAYSQGMRQRLGLALAMLAQPDLLILDEPTNGLDPAGIQEMRALLRQLPSEYGVTVFLSSHLLSEVEQVATHVGVLSRGRMVFDGRLNDLRDVERPMVAVGVDREADAARLLTVHGYPAAVNSSGRLLAEANPDQAAAVNELLVTSGFRVHHLTASARTLEERFLELTEAGS